MDPSSDFKEIGYDVVVPFRIGTVVDPSEYGNEQSCSKIGGEFLE